MNTLTNSQYDDKSREMPGTDIIFGLSPIILAFLIYLEKDLLDLFPILDQIPLGINLTIFLILIGCGLYLIIISHKLLFIKDRGASNVLIRTGILSKTRNPLYLGINLIYLGVCGFAMSFFALIFWAVMTLVFSKMVRYEEKIMEIMFGEEFRRYMEEVPRWIPKFLK
jgi:protein-S-isoprenylcysteine O-methyltransferase Ste14